MTAPSDVNALIEALVPAVRAAGALIEAIRTRGITARAKTDDSPVTEADIRAEALLTDAIMAVERDARIIGEEASAAGICPDPTARFWLIDPLDGTKDFIAGGADYSVNVALIEHGRPVLGLVFAPRDGSLWAGGKGIGAFHQTANGTRTPIATRRLPHLPVVVTSRSHLDAATKAYVAALAGADTRPSGSSLKFCLLAEGLADIYPRFGPTSEWDTAAGHAVLLAAGGAMRDAEGRAFAYGKPDFLNGPFLALGDPDAYATLPPLATR